MISTLASLNWLYLSHHCMITHARMMALHNLRHLLPCMAVELLLPVQCSPPSWSHASLTTCMTSVLSHALQLKNYFRDYRARLKAGDKSAGVWGNSGASGTKGGGAVGGGKRGAAEDGVTRSEGDDDDDSSMDGGSDEDDGDDGDVGDVSKRMIYERLPAAPAHVMAAEARPLSCPGFSAANHPMRQGHLTQLHAFPSGIPQWRQQHASPFARVSTPAIAGFRTSDLPSALALSRFSQPMDQSSTGTTIQQDCDDMFGSAPLPTLYSSQHHNHSPVVYFDSMRPHQAARGGSGAEGHHLPGGGEVPLVPPSPFLISLEIDDILESLMSGHKFED